MYRFILGGAASGKTTYIYEEIIRKSLEHPERRYYLFVPEQNTLMVQKAIAALSPRGGMLNIDVLSFTLLTYRVLSELGRKKPDVLDDMTRSLLIRKAMRQRKKELRIYSRKTDSRGLLDELRQAIAEFCQYDIDEEKLRSVAETDVSRRLRDKLLDISEIYGTFRSLLSSSEVIPEELPGLLLSMLPSSSLLSGSEIYFDGFTGYTPIQLRLIAHILDQADEVSFAVTIPGEELRRRSGDDADIFWMSRESISSIGGLADRGGIVHGEDVVLEGKRRKPVIRISRPEDVYTEVRELAKDIRRRTVIGEEKGRKLRYCDISVAVPDMSVYRELIRNEFDKAGISYFMDENASSDNSLTAELLKTVLAVVTKGYRYDDVSRYSKNPLIKLKDEDINECKDIFDNYIRAKGIRGRAAFEREWQNTYRHAESLRLDKLNEYKDELMGPVLRLHDELRSAEDIRGYTDALLNYLSEIGFEESTGDFIRLMEESGYPNEAAAEAGVAENSLLLLERMGSIMGSDRASVKEFTELLLAGIGSIKAGVIPQSMDMLSVGDLKRSRFDGTKLLYILGANEGQIPAGAQTSGIFTEQERDELMRAGIELAPQSVRLAASEYFYLYLLLNKPGEELVIFCPGEDREGRGLREAEFIRDLEASDMEPGSPFFFSNIREALHAFSEGLNDIEEKAGDRSFLTLYNYLRQDGGAEKKADIMLKAALLPEAEPKLYGELASELYGGRLECSVTRIEAFERCAYAHFLRYGLSLYERQQYDIEAVDIGNLYHSAIERTFRRLTEEKKSINDISEDELKAIGQRAVDEVTEEYNDSILQSSARNSFIKNRVSRITGKTLWALRSQAGKGDFRTAYCEFPFRIKEEGIELHGRIDRVDLYEEKLDTYVKVIDYKSGKTRFDLSMVYQGLQLQLVTYMDAALSEIGRRHPGRSVDPAGIYYYNIDDPVIKYGDLDASKDRRISAEERQLSALRMNGLANSDMDMLIHQDRELEEGQDIRSDVIPVKLKGGSIAGQYSSVCGTEGFRRLMAMTRKRILGDSERILEGEISIRPFRTGQKTGCDYCPYHSVCGFDTAIGGHGYRELRSLSQEELRTRLFGEEGRSDVGSSKMD